MEEKTKVAIFIRASENSQDKLNELTAYAEEKNCKIVATIRENTNSNKESLALALKELIEGAEKGKYEKVLISKIKRFTDSPIETQSIIKQLDELNVSIDPYTVDLKFLETLQLTKRELILVNVLPEILLLMKWVDDTIEEEAGKNPNVMENLLIRSLSEKVRSIRDHINI